MNNTAELMQARDVVVKYSRWHPIRTRGWNVIGIGSFEVLTDSVAAEWETVDGITIGRENPNKSENKARNGAHKALANAGLAHINIQIVSMTEPVIH
jgi:hypothetical protein